MKTFAYWKSGTGTVGKITGHISAENIRKAAIKIFQNENPVYCCGNGDSVLDKAIYSCGKDECLIWEVLIPPNDT